MKDLRDLNDSTLNGLLHLHQAQETKQEVIFEKDSSHSSEVMEAKEERNAREVLKVASTSLRERETSLLTTYWSESTSSSR